MTPLILLPSKLTTDARGVRGDSFSTGRRYSQAVDRCGGVVLQLPPLNQSVESAGELVSGFDGVLIQGGGDIDPALYGQAQISDKIYGINAEHDALEMAIVLAAVSQNKPVLAICRGMQILNVALGGTLHQDLGKVIEDGEAHWNTYHAIMLSADSRVARAMNTTSPNRSHSYHHQSLDMVANDLMVTGRSADDIIEAVEHKSAHWIVGVQWHPEDDADTEPDQQNLFAGFVKACQPK